MGPRPLAPFGISTPRTSRPPSPVGLWGDWEQVAGVKVAGVPRSPLPTIAELRRQNPPSSRELGVLRKRSSDVLAEGTLDAFLGFGHVVSFAVVLWEFGGVRGGSREAAGNCWAFALTCWQQRLSLPPGRLSCCGQPVTTDSRCCIWWTRHPPGSFPCRDLCCFLGQFVLCSAPLVSVSPVAMFK